ncbi:MAG: hypothetical protein JW967_06520 [Dehalococcoidales bacterium]|nr:hypothetical protein [Dehalococcoidales bacterium]
MFDIYWTERSKNEYFKLKADFAQVKRYKAVKKTIEFLAANPRHNSLQTHEFTSLKGPSGEKIYVAYAQQATPAAYRVFWFYGPDKDQITIFAVTRHP